MSREAIILCIFAVLLLWQPWSAVATVLVPPKGYSVGFSGTIARGYQKYVCSRGSWIKSGSSADMYSPDGSKLGTYWSVYNQKTGAITGFWNIINSEGVLYESGYRFSGLQATPVRNVHVSSSSVAEYLAIVKVHRYAGDASQVAFVSLTGTKGGLPPRKELCTSSGAMAGAPFTGTFKFYDQDRVPPQVPASLTPKATFVQVVFLEGMVTYKFSSGQWRYQGIFATMAEVAGGTVLGKFGTVAKADRYGSKLSWHFTGPNGFWISGQPCAKAIQMSGEGYPWQLLKITSSGGTVSPIGAMKFALIGGTLGGLAPKVAARTNGITWSSPITAQCYLYTK